jgi:hypothetical protein
VDAAGANGFGKMLHLQVVQGLRRGWTSSHGAAAEARARCGRAAVLGRPTSPGRCRVLTQCRARAASWGHGRDRRGRQRQLAFTLSRAGATLYFGGGSTSSSLWSVQTSGAKVCLNGHTPALLPSASAQERASEAPAHSLTSYWRPAAAGSARAQSLSASAAKSSHRPRQPAPVGRLRLGIGPRPGVGLDRRAAVHARQQVDPVKLPLGSRTP